MFCSTCSHASRVGCIRPRSSRVVKLWKESLSKVNVKAAASLADPTAYSNMFPGLQQALEAERHRKEATRRARGHLSESSAGSAPNGPAIVQTFTEPLDAGTQQNLKPGVAQEQEGGTEATGPGDDQESSAPLGTEPRVPSPKRAPSEGHTDTGGDSAEDEDVEAELGDKVKNCCRFIKQS